MQKRIILGTVTLLTILAAAYLIRGTYFMFTLAADYQQRWCEQHYLLRGKNPLDIFQRYIAEWHNLAPPASKRDDKIDSDLGNVLGGYPPWAYGTGFAFCWSPTMKLGRAFFGGWNLLLLGFVFYWAYRLWQPQGWIWAWLLAAAVAATSSICTTLGLGQYGVLVLAALVAALVLDERNRHELAGIALGVALTKVIMAGPFLLPFLFKRRWKTLFFAFGYITVASLMIWPMSKTNPLEMLAQMCATSVNFGTRGSHDLIVLFIKTGLPTATAMKLAAAVSLVLFVPLFYFWRHVNMLVQFAIAALLSRIWTTHSHCDNLILEAIS